VSGEFNERDLQTAAAIVAGYGKGKDETRVAVLLHSPNREETTLEVTPDTTPNGASAII
jgi:hypothetical protein